MVETAKLSNIKPQENPILIGHEAAEERFVSAWQSDRLPHSWLITGPKGIGKATLAYRIARFVLASASSVQPAGLFDEDRISDLYIDSDNSVFRHVANSTHADLQTLCRTVHPDTNKPRTSIVVADVRAAGRFMRLTTSADGWRVVIVDSVDEMNLSAANALLKVLEEPPEHTLLMLVSHSPGQLLSTIRSRCCQLKLQKLTDECVSKILALRSPDIPEAERLAIIRLSEGSPGRAFALIEDDGLALYRQLLILISNLPNPPVLEIHAFGDKLARVGAEQKFCTAMELLSYWLGRLARSGAEQGNAPLAIVPEEEGVGARLLAGARVDRLIEVWEKINRLTNETTRLNLDRKQVLLTVFYVLQGVMNP